MGERTSTMEDTLASLTTFMREASSELAALWAKIDNFEKSVLPK